MPTLYDLTAEALSIFDELSDSLGELTPELEQRMDAFMLQGPEKLEAAAMMVRSMEQSAAACEAESDRLRARAKAFEVQISNLKTRMTACLDAGFNGKIKTSLFTIWTQKSADRTVADLVPGVTPEMLHKENPELVRVKYELDREACVRIYKIPAGERVGMLPELILFEEKKGSTYVRIK